MYLRSMPLRSLMILAAALFAFLDCVSTASLAEDADPAELRREVAKLVAELDSESFDVRRAATGRLENLVTRPELAPLLIAEFQAVAKAPNASLEVRSVLEPLLAILAEVPRKPLDSGSKPADPAEAATTERDVSPGEFNRLLDDLDADSFHTRTTANNRLQPLVANTKLAGQALVLMKLRLANPSSSAESRIHIRRLCDQARGAWLLSDPATWKLPDPTPAQIAGWLDDLARPVPVEWNTRTWPVHESAAQELLDLLVRDDWLPKVKAALETRLEAELTLAKDGVPTEACERIQRILDWTRPAMVAEFWQGAHHKGIQHLLIGVPNHSEGADRASHFDQINDETAHCVSGNSLSPGNYPVGVFFPHPVREEAQFHLVNLPTPRKRLAYEHLVKRDESKRLAEISERTAAWLLKQKRQLTEREVMMLRHINPDVVSRFAGKYFSAVDDEPYRADSEYRLAGRTSRHGMFCVVLAEVGTQEAIPGLLAAIKAGRFLPPAASTTQGDSPYDLPWIAALAIAGRDPWSDVDHWLAGLIERETPLKISLKNPPELGATAAALLLRRHSAPAAMFSLEPVEDAQMNAMDCPAFRFAVPDKRAEILQWWAEHKNRVAANAFPQP
jgi:hypothetical protein